MTNAQFANVAEVLIDNEYYHLATSLYLLNQRHIQAISNMIDSMRSAGNTGLEIAVNVIWDVEGLMDARPDFKPHSILYQN